MGKGRNRRTFMMFQYYGEAVEKCLTVVQHLKGYFQCKFSYHLSENLIDG